MVCLDLADIDEEHADKNDHSVEPDLFRKRLAEKHQHEQGRNYGRLPGRGHDPARRVIGGETDQGVKTTEADAAADDPEQPVPAEFRKHPPEVSQALEGAKPQTEKTHHVQVAQGGRPVPVPAFETHGPVEDEGGAEKHASGQAEQH